MLTRKQEMQNEVHRAYMAYVDVQTRDSGWTESDYLTTLTASIEPESEPAAFGNVLAGGIIGAAIDMGSGAAWFYPPTITVQLRKE